MRTVLAALFVLLLPLGAEAQDAPDPTPALVDLGGEYGSFEQGRGPSRSSNAPKDRSFVYKLFMYIPNRLLDAIDIFRVDAGIGSSFGAVGRVTKYGQFGYRSVSPASVRVGLRGRKLPFFVERSSEFGVGPTFLESKDRDITPVEVGVGADLFLVGAYVGVSVDEALDFALGLVGFDIKGDDR